MSRPSTLFLAANIWGDIRSTFGAQNILPAQVIERFIRHSFERQIAKKVNGFLTMAEREYFMLGVAVGMLRETRLTNSIGGANLREIVVRLTEQCPDTLSQGSMTEGGAKARLRDRLNDKEMLAESIFADVRSCGILVADITQTSVFKFAHKSFFELLVALHVVGIVAGKGRDPKEVEMHRAIRRAVGAGGDVLLVGYPGALSRDICQFAAELLYHQAVQGRADGLLEKGLEEKGIEVSKFKTFARLLRPAVWPFSIYGHMFFASGTSEFIYGILARVYKLHGRGGEEFLALSNSEVGFVKQILADISQEDERQSEPS